MDLPKKNVGILELYTHGVRILAKDDRVKVACRRLLTDWTVVGEKKVENSQGEMVSQQFDAQVYGTAFKGSNDFWFHKGQLKSLETEFNAYGIAIDDFEIKIIPVHVPRKYKYSLKAGRVMRDYQAEALQFGLAPVNQGDHFSKLIAMPTGTGKMAPLDEPVLTPSDWIMIGDLRVGDEVITANGSITTVKGIYPQGIQEVFQVTFKDGRSTRAGLDHLWRVYDKEWITVTTREMIEMMKDRSKEVYVPFYAPGTGNDLELPKDPYKLGVEFDGKKIFSNEYLFASLEQRYQLAEGLFESWGSADGISITMTFENIKVAEQIVDLYRSLGKLASLDRNDLFGNGMRQYIVTVVSKDPKLANWRDEQNSLAGVPGIEVTSIEFDGFEECVCIEVDHPSHLYVTRDYVVTHNTVTLCGTAAHNGERLAVAVLPKYCSKWAIDLSANLDISKKDIMIIEKVSQLRGVIDMCKTQGSRKLPPLIVVTLTTLRAFYDKYAEDPQACVEDMGCAPWELGRILDIGLFAIDEAHEHLHTVFRTAMYLHGVKFVALSGTMRTENDFDEKIQNTIFPQIKRFLKVKMEKYIDVEFIGYNFDHSILPRIRCSAFGRTDYNHPTLEKSIMKLPAVMQGYLDMVTELLDFDYIPRAKGHRALIFVGTVEMADKMISELKQKYPSLNIARYCAAQGDEYEDLLSADITVSTLQSSGTAVDIPNLITVICTTMVNSSKSNLQALGRLRKLASGQRVSMFMPYCKQIRKHIQYTTFRYELFQDIVKSLKTFNYSYLLGKRY